MIPIVQSGVTEQHLYRLVEELEGRVALLEAKDYTRSRVIEHLSSKCELLGKWLSYNHNHIVKVFKKQQNIRCVLGEHISSSIRRTRKTNREIDNLTALLPDLAI